MAQEILLDQRSMIDFAPDIYTAAALEASKPMHEVLNLKVSGETMTKFLKTSNGAALLSSLGSLMSFLALEKEVELAAVIKAAGR
jgi:hypothetical protein